MKRLKTIIKQKPVFLHLWKSKMDIIINFEDLYMSEKEYYATESPYPNEEYWKEKKEKMRKALEEYKDINILFASYNYKNYSGDAFVLFEKKGKLYEVNGSHCSCFGLEGQWKPEETDLKSLQHRLLKGGLGEPDWCGNEFKDELLDFLGIKKEKK